MMMKKMFLAAAALSLMTGAALAEGDAAKGEKVFNQCKACHDAEKGVNKVGPTLKGIIGRQIATVEGYNYSEDMKAFGAARGTWDDATFLEYIENPKKDVPKTKMAFPGIKKEDQRADLLAYLKTKM
jgi:cytochrome c